MVGHSKGRHMGSVTGWKTALDHRECLEYRYTVAYEDTQHCEHVLNDLTFRAWVVPNAFEGVQTQWQRLAPTCMISMQRLTRPARGEHCRHPALCNEAELRGYVGREKKCPIALCTASLERTASVVVDYQLQSQLLLLPLAATHFYYGPGGEVRASAPPPCQELQRKRKRADGQEGLRLKAEV
uniref:Uncharacterized protein n=1 Tax=Haptolina brevifila TaxID=156173 RepID=A0A7S2HZ06_9EUKA|mmetsp:Transcript_59384/g.117975  ORF Transcript_59384/g.117975 Transcript_59384/m.117975 type:complete len:183 (+) Transcript_59384:149-697(+)